MPYESVGIWPIDQWRQIGLNAKMETIDVSAMISLLYTLQWHRVVPHSAKVRGWTITPSHFLNQQLDAVRLAE